MKVLRICPDFFCKPENIHKGLSVYFFNLMPLLSKLNINQEIIALRSDSESFLGNKIHLLKEKSPFTVFRTGKICYGLIKSESMDFDIVNTHQYSFFSLYHYKNKIKKPMVHTIHGGPFVGKNLKGTERNYNFKNELYNYYFNRYVCKRADAVVVNSKDIKDEMVQRYKINADKVEIIPTGVNTDFFTSDKTIKKDIDIIFVGRFVPVKSLILLLETTLALRKEFNQIKVCLVGGKDTDSDYANVCKFTSENSLSNNVTLVGTVTPDELLNYYRRSKILVICSYSEGMPKVILEAMSCELGIVTSNVGGLKDIIVDSVNGLSFDYPNISEFCNKIELLLNDNSLLLKLGENARKTVVENYTWESIAKKYNELYKKLLG